MKIKKEKLSGRGEKWRKRRVTSISSSTNHQRRSTTGLPSCRTWLLIRQCVCTYAHTHGWRLDVWTGHIPSFTKQDRAADAQGSTRNTNEGNLSVASAAASCQWHYRFTSRNSIMIHNPAFPFSAFFWVFPIKILKQKAKTLASVGYLDAFRLPLSWYIFLSPVHETLCTQGTKVGNAPAYTSVSHDVKSHWQDARRIQSWGF